jgi:hypothetical protein
VRRALRIPFLVTGATFLVIQLVPYGWEHPNPPVVQDAPWPSAPAEGLARSSCYDCHSNEVEWPLQAYVAPASWLVRRDVDLGRDELNFSEWDDHDSEADDAAEAVLDGSMPPRRYTLLHPDAALSDAEKQSLAAALEAMDD